MTLPFYFVVIFWGDKFRNYLLELILPSLLAPNNIPALHDKKNSKFLICTTQQDWRLLQQQEIFVFLKKYIQPHFLPMNKPHDNDNKMLIMSKSHKESSEIIFENKGIGVFVTPDLIISNGAIARLQKLILQGKKVILSAAIRFEYNGSIKMLKKMNKIQDGKPLVLSGREIMSAVLGNLHSEIKRFIWDSDCFAETPISCIWYDKKKTNCIIHTYSWGPLAINYATLPIHDVSTFEKWTMDGDYIYKNFGNANSRDIYIVKDTDEIAFASFTTEDEMHIPSVSNPIQRVLLLKTIIKKNGLSRIHHSAAIDPLKKQLVKIPIFFHNEDISKELKKISRKSKKIIKKTIVKEPAYFENKEKNLLLICNIILSPKKIMGRVLKSKNKLLATITTNFIKKAKILIIFIKKARLLIIRGEFKLLITKTKSTFNIG